MHFPVLLTRHEPLRVQEHTQRSRSFLYAALACVVARLFGKTRIRFFENGVVSINLPISEQVVGARATRTTHPVVLERFRRFFGEPIEVENQFIWKTKADVIRSIVDRGCGSIIKHTASCTRSYDIIARVEVLQLKALAFGDAERSRISFLAIAQPPFAESQSALNSRVHPKDSPQLRFGSRPRKVPGSAR
jgi:hypothetical protein